MSKLIRKISKHFNDYTTPISTVPRDGLLYWREKILLYIIYVIIVFASIAYIPSIILSVSTELWLAAIVDTVAYVFLLYLFFSKSLSVSTRAIAIMALTYFLGVFLLITVGPYGAGYLWLFAVPILSTILMNTKTAMYSIVLNLITLLIIAFLIENNVILPFIKIYFSFSAWFVLIANLTFLEIILALSIVMIAGGLEKSLLNEKETSRSLERKSEELVKTKNEALKADAMKSEFLAQMSHEIRTPINTILNATSLLQDDLPGLSDDEKKEIFDMIKTGSGRIIRTIDLILNMSEIQTGSYKKHIEELDLFRDILRPLIVEFTYSAAQKGLSLSLNPQSKRDYKFFSDRYSVTQIFSNLIDNAIKYTKEGSVTINIAEDEKSIIVDIMDTGIGISQSYFENMFKPFSQEDSGYTRHFEGNGLGLSLVKRYCETNDAKISVQSEKGKGSKFTVTFPKSSIERRS
ncbi:MAG: HAMP domain-containing histidine kinase [Bacteroidetes bacterium]|nr:HAMP domain-containing histidine kinase [Bacteroidota bacterium]MCL6099067.1 HAMP domain-containing histidine kinase [Bacteroidota bacterium]